MIGLFLWVAERVVAAAGAGDTHTAVVQAAVAVAVEQRGKLAGARLNFTPPNSSKSPASLFPEVVELRTEQVARMELLTESVLQKGQQETAVPVEIPMLLAMARAARVAVGLPILARPTDRGQAVPVAMAAWARAAAYSSVRRSCVLTAVLAMAWCPPGGMAEQTMGLSRWPTGLTAMPTVERFRTAGSESFRTLTNFSRQRLLL
jgi:hypothetical protein